MGWAQAALSLWDLAPPWPGQGAWLGFCWYPFCPEVLGSSLGRDVETGLTGFRHQQKHRLVGLSPGIIDLWRNTQTTSKHARMHNRMSGYSILQFYKAWRTLKWTLTKYVNPRTLPFENGWSSPACRGWWFPIPVGRLQARIISYPWISPCYPDTSLNDEKPVHISRWVEVVAMFLHPD